MADLNVRTYDPSKIIVTFGGVPLSGFSEGTFVSIKRSGDVFTKVKGADGGIDRVNNCNYAFEVTFTCKQTTPTNEYLSGLLAADQLSNAGTLPLVVKDNLGSTIFTAMQAWIKKDPDVDFADKLSDRTWTFDTGPAVLLAGGN